MAAPTEAEIEILALNAQQRFSIAGRRVLITGAANGLGRTMALAFASAGAKVAAIDRELLGLEALCAHVPMGFIGVGDVTDPAVENVAKEAVSALGGLDILVNNAGVTPYAGIASGSAKDLSYAFEVNCGGAARLVRATVDALRTSGRGRIINLASLAVMMGIKEIGAFVAAKSAVIGMTRSLAGELGEHNITVNVIAPGFFPTRASLVIPDQEKLYATMMANQVIKRLGSQDDIACTVMFLASDAASFITGQTILVDGGQRYM